MSKYTDYKTNKVIQEEKPFSSFDYKTSITIQEINKDNEVIAQTETTNTLTNQAINVMFHNMLHNAKGINEGYVDTLSSFGNMLLINNVALKEDKTIKKIDLKNDIVSGFVNMYAPARTENIIQGTLSPTASYFNYHDGEICLTATIDYDRCVDRMYTHICFAPAGEFVGEHAEPIYWANKIHEHITYEYDLSLLTFTSEGKAIYYNPQDYCFYNCMILNVGEQKKIYPTTIYREMQYTPQYEPYKLVGDGSSYYLIERDNITYYITEFNSVFNYVRTYGSIDLNVKSNFCLFHGDLYVTDGNYYFDDDKLKSFKFKNRYIQEEERTEYYMELDKEIKGEDLNISKFYDLYTNGEYLYISCDYISGKINYDYYPAVALFELQKEKAKDNNEEIEKLVHVITNRVRVIRDINIYTHGYFMDNTFVSKLTNGNIYLSTSIFGYGTISKLPFARVKSSEVSHLVEYKFYIRMGSTDDEPQEDERDYNTWDNNNDGTIPEGTDTTPKDPTDKNTDDDDSGSDYVSKVLKLAKSKVGCQYVWGAKGEILTASRYAQLKSTFGASHYKAYQTQHFGEQVFDCSGFVWWCWKTVTGVSIGTSTSNINSVIGGTCTIPWSSLQKGDLLLSPGRHVGMYLGNGKYIHASQSKPYPDGGVKISTYNASTHSGFAKAVRPITYVNKKKR